jgi:predicted esterase
MLLLCIIEPCFFVFVARSGSPHILATMSDQTAQTTWSLKYKAKNDTAPPPIYAQVNASVLGAQPGEASESSSRGKFPRLPKERDFPKNIENRIIDNAPNEDIHHIIVVLHGFGADTEHLLEFSKKHLLGPNTACILVRGTKALVHCEGAYCWSDDCESSSRFRANQARNNGKNKRQQTGLSSIRSSTIPGPSRSNTAGTTRSLENFVAEPDALQALDVNENEDPGSPPTFALSTEQVGVNVITDVLIKKCGFRARDIALVGHDEGGSAALAVAAACCDTEFGGVVSIGGILPSDFPNGLPQGDRSPTHVLLLGGSLGDVNNREVLRIETAFAATTKAQKVGKWDDFNEIEDAKLKEFLAHQLWRAEWTKEAVATFGRF